MKQIAFLILAFICCLMKPAFAGNYKWRERPDYIPSMPPATKAITAYTAADIFAAVATTSSQIPEDHPYRKNNFTIGLKTNWPGAKDSKQIDTMIQIVLDAPPAERRDILAFCNNRWAFDNIRYIMWKIMDISDAERADALIRVVNAQTDQEKKYRARNFAKTLFSQLLDTRLLAYEKEDLDNTRIVFSGYITDETRATITARDVARDSIIPSLRFLKMTWIVFGSRMRLPVARH